MKSISKALAKTTVATVAAGAMAMTSAAPAFARDRGHDKIDAGDVIAGAVILGGIAAILSSGNKRDRYHQRYDHRYDGRRGNGQRAIERCVRAAERDARRGGYRFADVTQIRDVDRTRYGWRVKGRIVVDGQRGYGNRYNHRYNNRGYNDRYDRGYNYNHRGYNRDKGKFTCTVSRGQGAYVDFKGIRGLR